MNLCFCHWISSSSPVVPRYSIMMPCFPLAIPSPHLTPIHPSLPKDYIGGLPCWLLLVEFSQHRWGQACGFGWHWQRTEG